MDGLLKNWKTGIAGVIIIVMAVLGTFAGIKVPGFNMDLGAALTTGLALILAKDNNVTGT